MVLIYGAAISYRPIRSIENNQFFASLLDHSIKSTRERKIDGNNWPIRSDTWTKKWVFIFHEISIFLQAEQKPKMPLMPFNHIQLREFLLRLGSLASFEIFCCPHFCVSLSWRDSECAKISEGMKMVEVYRSNYFVFLNSIDNILGTQFEAFWAGGRENIILAFIPLEATSSTHFSSRGLLKFTIYHETDERNGVNSSRESFRFRRFVGGKNKRQSIITLNVIFLWHDENLLPSPSHPRSPFYIT